jgi:hypothetical protein
MAQGNRQFDPVAASATAALNATQRSLQSLQSDVGAPQAPAQSQAFTQSRNILNTVAQASPFNVLARGQAPGLPGAQGQNPLQALPGMGAQGQNPLQNLPFMGGQGAQGLPPTPQGFPGPNAQGGGNATGGGTSGGNGGNGGNGRRATEKRT